MKQSILLLLAMVYCAISYSQESFQTNYSFIENVGQFEQRNWQQDNPVRFAYSKNPFYIFFGEKGVTYRFDKIIKNPNRDKTDPNSPKRMNISELVKINWIGANENIEIIAEDESSDYFSYAIKNFSTKEVTNKNNVRGFKKITYKNLYDNIDLVYTIHPVSGVKYSFVLHPGADPSEIQLKYSTSQTNTKGEFISIQLENEELHIQSSLGEIIEHRPETFYAASNRSIKSSYLFIDHVLSFKLDDYNSEEEVIIDPWINSPTYQTSTAVWEVETDAAGNVYTIGGETPMELKKYNSTGTLQWTYTTPWDTNTVWLGTLATDAAGTSYVTSGTEPQMERINNGGGMVWHANGGGGLFAPTSEWWSITFNCDKTKLIVGGTFVPGVFSFDYYAAIFDIDVSNGDVLASATFAQTDISGFGVTPVEVRSITSSKNAKYIYLTHEQVGAINQNLGTCPVDEPVYQVDNAKHLGYKCENYLPATQNGGGLKALVANDNYFYTHSGDQIRQWDLLTGALLNTVALPGGVSNTVPIIGGTVVHNSGLAVDNCGNIYAGATDRVVKFDASLNILSSSPTTFAVYDVSVNSNGEVIAVGAQQDNQATNRNGRIESIGISACAQYTLVCCDATICPVNPVCQNAGTIPLSVATPGGTWSGSFVDASGNFDPAASGPGTFVVTYTLACGAESVSITVTNCDPISVCEETNGTLTATGGDGTYTWYTGTVTPVSTPIFSESDCISCGGTPSYIPFTTIYTGCSISNCNSTDTTWTQYATGSNAPAPAGYPLMITDGGVMSLVVNDASEIAPCTVTPCSGVTITVTASTQTNVSCNGANDGTATVTATGGTGPYTYDWSPGSLTGTSQTGLSPGTYTVTATDFNTCSGSGTVTITEPTLLSVSASSTPATCGASNGSATATPSGGTGPYSYSWAPSGGTTAIATGLSAGSYTVTVTDANTCTANFTVDVTNTGGPTISLSSSSDVSCNGGNNGAATVSATGGTGPYTYSWAPGSLSGASQTALTAGTYTVTVTDAGTCTDQMTVTINEPSILSVSAIGTDESCGGSNGSATATATGGVGPYTYSWAPSGGNSATATNLSAGTYTVTATDAQTCTATFDITINNTGGPTLSLSSSSDVSCGGGNDGAATVIATGGTGPYTYSWSPGSLSGATQSTLTAGTYTVTVTDAGTCTDQITVTINEPTILSVNATTTPATCGGSNGSATATASGGAGGYTYSWSPSGGSAATATGLSAGTYTVTVTDANTCTATFDANVGNTGGPTISLSSSSDVSCNGGNDGAATVNATGGTGPYTYSWSPGALSGATQSSLTAGTYTVTVTDAGSCINQLTVTIGEPTVLSVSATSTPAACGASDGSATATASGGAGGYSYSWSPSGGTAATATNLASGTYTVMVTDANTCTADFSVDVTNSGGPAISLSTSNDVSCNGGNNGSATVNTTGGTGPYTYSWAPGSLSGASQSTLTAGTYTVTVNDANSCTDQLTVTINEPSILSVSATGTDATCGASDGSAIATASGGTGAYTYSWSPSGGSAATATNLAAGTYTVTVTDANTCTADFSVNVGNTGGPTLTVSSASDVSCNSGNDGSATVNATGGTSPYTYSWSPGSLSGSTQTGLQAGTYTVTATDAGGCINQVSVTINEPNALLITEQITDANCGFDDGSITTTVSGGTGPYSYLWTPNNEITDNITNLAGGSYSLTVTDANSCTTSENYTVNNVGNLLIDAQPAYTIIDLGTSVNLSASGAESFVWTPNTGLSCSNCANPIATPTSTTTYIVEGINANGCVGYDTLTIQVNIVCGEIYVPNIFSPDDLGPNANETVCVFGDCIVELKFQVFDRWGELVFSTEDPEACWDGTYKGKQLISGVYVYTLYARLVDDTEVSRSGNITLVK